MWRRGRELPNRIKFNTVFGRFSGPRVYTAASALQMGSLEDVRQSAEKRHIRRALAATSGEVGAASKLLGIGRTTLWEKMRRLGLNGVDLDVTL
jgi:transcriptional regulator of acetoin/glycerol metabolism